MLKPTPARVILALLGGLALILIAAWSSGLHHQICKEAQTNQENCATYNLAPFVIIQIFKALDAASVAITALATVAIGWFTFTLWRATTGTLKVALDSVQLAREEFLSTQRPKIKLKHFWLANDNIWNEKPVIVNFWVVNTGTSNAIGHLIGLRHFVIHKNESLPIDPTIPTLTPIGGRPLIPGLNWQYHNIDTKIIITRAQADDIRQSKRDLYFIGYISYFDGAGRMRITGFCRKLQVPERDWSDISKCRFYVEMDPDYEYED
jgi:hypothetical protein